MPYVNIRLTDDGVTPEQKSELIRGVTDVMVRVLGKNPDNTHIVIDEIALTNWGFGGQSVAERRKAAGK